MDANKGNLLCGWGKERLTNSLVEESFGVGTCWN